MFTKDITITLVLFAIALTTVHCDRPEDLVNYKWLTDLPSDYNTSVNLYSGYLNIGQKRFHYVFATSQDNPFKDPLVVWFNGGPGCSSLFGLLYEHGPFIFTSGETPQKLQTNKNSWNKHSNVLYLETPVSTGFSYSYDETDLHTDDTKTTQDHLEIIVEFFKGYPEFSRNEVYLAGEDYAGIYVPLLAHKILEYNRQVPAPVREIKLKGIMVGNGITYWPIDGPHLMPGFLASHAIIDLPLKAEFKQKCTMDPPTKECQEVLDRIKDQTKHLTLYNIYARCNEKKGYKPSKWQFPVDPGDSCVDVSGATSWLNDPSVKIGLNIAIDSPNWAVCSNKLDYKIDYKGGSLWAYPDLLESGVKALIYSGDVDAVVITMNTINWLRKLRTEQGYMTRTEYKSWTIKGTRPKEAQVAGYFQEYDPGLYFYTVRGAGHMVPMDKPEAAYEMINRFINNRSDI